MADDNKAVEIKELSRFTMWTRPKNKPNAKAAKLCFCIRDSCPRITVYTNDPDDTERYGIIYAAFDPESFFVLLDIWREIVNGPNDNKVKVECKFRPTVDGVKGDLTVMTSVLLGKDAEGICWISLLSNDGNRPKLKFESTLSFFHAVTMADGSQMSKTEGSKRHTLALITFLDRVYGGLCAAFREKGVYNRTKPNTPIANNAKTEVTFDDDIPF